MLAPDETPPDGTTVPLRRPRVRWGRLTALAGALVLAYASLPVLVLLGPGHVVVPPDTGPSVTEQAQRRGGPGRLGRRGRAPDVTLTVRLQNQGPLPMTVREVSLVDTDHPLLEPVEDGAEVALPPFGEALVERVYRYGGCRSQRRPPAGTIGRLRVETSVLGRSVTQTVPLDRPLDVRADLSGGCPDGTPGRGGGTRAPR